MSMSWLFAIAAVTAALIMSASPFLPRQNGKERDYAGAIAALFLCSIGAIWLRLYGY